MRIDLVIPDAELARALEAVLDHDGHEVRRGASARSLGGSDLLICVDPDHLGTSPARARLLLRARPGPIGAVPNEQELRNALEHGGTVVWDGPLRVNALRRSLGQDKRTAQRDPDTVAPALDPTHHDWVYIDVARQEIVGGSAGGLARLASARADLPLRIESTPLPAGLRQHVLDAREGSRLFRDGSAVRCAMWWSVAPAQRVLMLHDAPAGLSEGLASHVEVLAEVGKMAAVLAHEIRNPIASVAGALDLLRGELSQEDRDEVASLAGERLTDMRALLDDTLRMVRPLSGDPETIDLSRLVDSVVDSLGPDARFEGVTIERELCAHALEVSGRLDGLRQALLNLLINGVEAQADNANPKIHLRTEAEGQRAVLWVRDFGVGMPAEARERAFEPFYTTKSQGTGLGLAYVRRVAETMYGNVSVTAAEPGTRFRLEFPRQQ